MSLLNRLKNFLKLAFTGLRLPNQKRVKFNLTQRHSGKIFCIGFNKTGTTSLTQALQDFGYEPGNQAVSEMLLTDWHRRDFSRLIRFCYVYQAFQDVPFSLPETYRHLDEAFPDAKFILTIRSSSEQWYQSLVGYHTKLFSSDKSRPPDCTDLENALYRYKGFGMDMMRMIYDYPNVKLYDHAFYIQLYEDHNRNVIHYFRDRPDKLLTLDVSTSDAYEALGSFLQISVPPGMQFPWKNRT